MKMRRRMFVGHELGNKLEQWCDTPPSDVGRGEVIFDEEIKYSDGHRMVIQAVASLDPSSEPIWTQAILYTPEGNECGFTEAGEEFWGEYQVGDYVCLVQPELTTN